LYFSGKTGIWLVGNWTQGAAYRRAVSFSLFLTPPLLEFHFSHVHNSRNDLVNVLFFLLRETKDIKSFLYQIKPEHQSKVN